MGTKTGFEETNVNEKTQDKKFTNVVSLKSEKNYIDDLELNKILNIDPEFNTDDFLSGSKNFFKMVFSLQEPCAHNQSTHIR